MHEVLALPRCRLARLASVLACIAFLMAGCGSQAQPALSSGWTTYHDQRFPFQMLIPLGWHVTQVTNQQPDGTDCDYIVMVLPSDVSATSKNVSQLEQVYVRVVVNCPSWPENGKDPFFTVDPHGVTLSGEQAVLYDGGAIPNWIQRATVASFGGHEYIVGLQAPTTTAKRDTMLYTQMLQGFRYMGT